GTLVEAAASVSQFTPSFEPSKRKLHPPPPAVHTKLIVCPIWFRFEMHGCEAEGSCPPVHGGMICALADLPSVKGTWKAFWTIWAWAKRESGVGNRESGGKSQRRTAPASASNAEP